MAPKACHVFASTTQVGLTQVLDLALQKKVFGANSSLVLQVFVVGATRHPSRLVMSPALPFRTLVVAHRNCCAFGR
jgi:hypothetical protein